MKYKPPGHYINCESSWDKKPNNLKEYNKQAHYRVEAKKEKNPYTQVGSFEFLTS